MTDARAVGSSDPSLASWSAGQAHYADGLCVSASGFVSRVQVSGFEFMFGFVFGVLVPCFCIDPEVLSKIALRKETTSVALCECMEPLFGFWYRARGWQ